MGKIYTVKSYTSVKSSHEWEEIWNRVQRHITNMAEGGDIIE